MKSIPFVGGVVEGGRERERERIGSGISYKFFVIYDIDMVLFMILI